MLCTEPSFHSRKEELSEKHRNMPEMLKKKKKDIFVCDTEFIALGDVTRYMHQAMDKVDSSMNNSLRTPGVLLRTCCYTKLITFLRFTVV